MSHAEVESTTGVQFSQNAAAMHEVAIDINECRMALLTVVVPVYNEIATVKEVIQQVLREPTLKEVIVVDDGSTDGTTELLKDWLSEMNSQDLPPHISCLTMLFHPQNQGKGAAVRTGLEHARSEFFIVQDADLEVSPKEYPNLLKPLILGEADFVTGYRTSEAGSPTRYIHGLGVLVLNVIFRLLYNTQVKDEACCFKVLRTSDLKRMRLECHGFEFCPEVIAKAARLRLRFSQIPISYAPRNADDGKKLRLRDGLHAILTLWKYRRWNS